MTKQRLSVTVDAEVVAEAETAVREGHAVNISAYVEDALKQQLVKHRRLAAMGAFLRAYEKEHGKITREQIEEARRDFQSRAVRFRDGKRIGPQRASAPAARAAEGSARASEPRGRYGAAKRRSGR